MKDAGKARRSEEKVRDRGNNEVDRSNYKRQNKLV